MGRVGCVLNGVTILFLNQLVFTFKTVLLVRTNKKMEDETVKFNLYSVEKICAERG